MVRTDKDIVARVQAIERTGRDWLGVERNELVCRLSYDAARPLLKPDATGEGWGEIFPRDRDTIVKEMRDYMEFGWGKVLDHRGISASRTLSHMAGWLWLLEDDEMVGFVFDEANYMPYGAPVLKRICEKYEFPIPEGKTAARMGNGQPCRDGCEDGCLS